MKTEGDRLPFVVAEGHDYYPRFGVGRALDAAWRAPTGDAYVQEMQWLLANSKRSQ